MTKKKATKKRNATIDERLAARERQLTETFAEMAAAIDDYIKVSPMVFIEGEGSPAQYILDTFSYDKNGLNKFHKWIEVWMGSLYPRTMTLQEMICKQDSGNKMDDVYMDLCYDAQRFGYVLGVLVGCASMGADRNELLAKARGFIVNDLGHNRWRLEQETAAL